MWKFFTLLKHLFFFYQNVKKKYLGRWLSFMRYAHLFLSHIYYGHVCIFLLLLHNWHMYVRAVVQARVINDLIPVLFVVAWVCCQKWWNFNLISFFFLLHNFCLWCCFSRREIKILISFLYRDTKSQLNEEILRVIDIRGF